MTTAEATEGAVKTPPRLKQRYREEIRDSLFKEFGYSNVMQIPGVVKVVVNMGVGDAARDAKLINGAVNDLSLITGQKPEIRKARKSIAQFKLREGMPIGARVTLRGDRMWEFLDRLISIAASACARWHMPASCPVFRSPAGNSASTSTKVAVGLPKNWAKWEPPRGR
jgi:hypothetical protein